MCGQKTSRQWAHPFGLERLRDRRLKPDANVWERAPTPPEPSSCIRSRKALCNGRKDFELEAQQNCRIRLQYESNCCIGLSQMSSTQSVRKTGFRN